MNRILFKFSFLIIATLMVFAFSCEPNSSQVKGTNGKSNPSTVNFPIIDVVTGEGWEAPTVPLEGHMVHMVKKNSPYWWFDGYVTSRDEMKDRQRGKWYRFYNNRTFEYGIFQEHDGAGTWRYDHINETLFMKSADGSETMQWRLQMAKTNEKVIFIGPAVGPNKGDQGMLQPYLQKPQFDNIAW